MILDDNYFRQMFVCNCTPNCNTIKIRLEFTCICVKDNYFPPVSTILPLYIPAGRKVWHIYLFILSIKSGTFKNLLHT